MDIFRPIRRFFHGIGTILHYAPVLFHDQDWDYAFLLDILTTKLQRMERYFATSPIADREKCIHSIKECRLLLSRLRADDYLENALFSHEKRWGQITMHRSPVNVKGYTTSTTSWEKVASAKDEKEANESFKRAYTHADYMSKQDLARFLKVFGKNYDRWWD